MKPQSGHSISGKLRRLAGGTLARSGRALLAVIDDILDTSRTEAEHLVLERIEFDLAECIEAVVDRFAGQAHAKGLDLACQLSADLPHLVIGDPGRLGRVLSNLLDNALAFTQTGEVIVNAQVQSRAGDQACVHIEVMDTGIGIAAEDCQRVLAPRAFGGTGPGLAIAKELVERMDGEIGMTSELGAGTCFWLRVALRVAVSAVGTRADRPAVRRLLLVAPHRATREIVVAYARELGVEVLHCARPDEALALLRSASAAGACIDALMLDSRMFDADLAALEILAADGAIGRYACPGGLGRILLIPVGQDGRADRFARLRMDAWLTKPVRRTRLLDCLAGLERSAERRLDPVPALDSPTESDDSAVPVAEDNPVDREPALTMRENRDYAVTPIGDGPAGERPKVLIVDDDGSMHLLARYSLENAGFAYTGAMNGREAVATAGELLPQLVVIDVMMPGIDGFETCRRLRATPGCELIPILMVTGLDDVESIEQAYESGATDFLAKPINWSLMTHRLRYLLRGHATLAALHASEARNSALISAIPDALLRLDGAGRILQLEPGRMLRGLVSPAETPASNLSDLFPEALCSAIRQEIEAALTERSVREMEIELPGGDRESSAFDARFIAVDSEQVILLLRDVTERRRRQRMVHELAYRDGLTGLANRQQFDQNLSDALANARRRDDQVALFFLDLDQFKRINDSLGHGIGDEILRGAARRLRSAVEEIVDAAQAIGGPIGTTVARLGGDELTVILGGSLAEHLARDVAERILHRFREPFEIAGNSIVCTVSVGIALYPDNGDTLQALLEHADTAMYAAKLAGRNNYRFFTPSMGEAASRKLDIETRMRTAIEREEFVLHYQPVVDIATGETRGLEALLRWQDPERGLIGPSSFIPVAEESGLILPLGHWVIDEVGRQNAAWRAQGLSLGVSLNLSARQFGQRGLIERLLEVLGGSSSGSGIGAIELEITESLLLDRDPRFLETLTRLRAEGLRIAIDDFGTGYSSLANLRDLPIDTLKVDRVFIRDIGRTSSSDALVKTILGLARGLDLRVVAEGVETEEQLGFLAREGCHAAQGFLFAQPMSPSQLTTYLLRGDAVADTMTPTARPGRAPDSR